MSTWRGAYVYGHTMTLIQVNARIMAGRPPALMLQDGDGHGTAAGYRRHLRHGSQPCQPCTAAESQRAQARASARRLRKKSAPGGSGSLPAGQGAG